MFDLTQYETVADRVSRFQKLHLGGRIVTKVISLDNAKGEVLAMAEVYREHEDTQPAGVDYAFGVAATYPQSMRKFYVEDTVTSAVGRALSLVLDTDKKPTREDMQKVQAHSEVKAKVEQVKAKMAQTASEYIPVPKEDDPWTIAPAQQATTLESAVEMVKSGLGGTAVEETCKHGIRHWRTGTSKAGKPYGAWYCAGAEKGVLLNNADKCDPVWYEVDKETGKWKPQVKR
jgi:hypothetical protein